ncbi:UDP-N-acetylglucosamine transferase subunit ALG14 isoform X3 [Chlorocebus sabaeus]|uniref:UDP-N-acetylglucosamine transferase subunit ALG14 isoform X3 n=1 Tax=Chlorocebus sabaeus TaxID=60711 RepID=UPI003BF99925
MVCVLILAAAAGAVAAFLILRIWVVLRSRDFTPRESLSILVVAGSGGHTTEILRLLGSLSSAYSPRHYVIADTDEMSANKINSFELDRADRDPSNMYTKYYIHRIPRSREVRQSWPSTVFTTLHSTWVSFPLIHQVKPDLIRSGGCWQHGRIQFLAVVGFVVTCFLSFKDSHDWVSIISLLINSRSTD